MKITALNVSESSLSLYKIRLIDKQNTDKSCRGNFILHDKIDSLANSIDRELQS